MAKKTITQLVDDIDGTVLDDGAGETIEFGLGRKTYSIDLSKDNADSFRLALKPYLDHATPNGKARRSTRTGRTGGSGRSSAELKNIREWARDQGYAVAPRGRISADILRAWDASKSAK